jgi:integrase
MRLLMRQKITKRSVDAIVPEAADRFLWDTELAGFGLKVTPAGARVYVLQYRAGGRLRRYTIGRHGSPWTAEAARNEALRLLGAIARGGDPGQQKHAAKAEPTFAQFAERYLAEHAVLHKKPSTVRDNRSLLRCHLLPALGTLRLSAISTETIERLHREMGARPRRANYARDILAAMFHRAAEWGVVPEGFNPARRVRKYREKGRTRFLSQEELARLGSALAGAEQAGWSPPAAVAGLRLLIFTGARKSEILGLEWRMVEFERALLRLPDSKTGKKIIYLSAPALQLLAALPRIAGNPYVLPGEKSGQHLVNIEKTWRRVRRDAALEDVRIHDLRHSFAAIGAGAGLGLPLIGALLGHAEASTTERYSHLAADPVRAANEVIGRRLAAALAGAAGGEVVPLAGNR